MSYINSDEKNARKNVYTFWEESVIEFYY